ncbi:MAG: aminotransferase class I/II-fold pyridoxal phosphate-dependent enzyme [Rhizobacter sp.]|nr:aminotransferase class I/II-fold pyridoxal phosphate-dependent enzyme [Chlorobiales bacterium]
MIDLRSDTVTKPSAEMIASLSGADFRNNIGDDVYGEDNLTKIFEHEVAELLGKESALFVPSGTMANQLSIKVHTHDGDEVILESDAHIFNYESAAAGVLSRVQLRTVQGEKGILKAEQISDAIRPAAYWYPQTKLVCLENTHNRAGGTVYPLEEIEKISALCRERNLKLHLDGARLWNACAATGIPPKAYAQHFDTVAVCFSKGLGAPAGSAIVGSKSDIAIAHRHRKMWGGGMRQTGVLTAMAQVALACNFPKLKEDHAKAKVIAGAFAAHPKFEIDLASVQTNIVAVDVSASGKSEDDVISFFKSRGILIASIKRNFIRLVTHLDISREDAATVASAVQTF